MSDTASQALQSFSRGDFSACVRQLSSLPSSDPRVEHNRALAELMANDLRGVDKYRSLLARFLGVSYPRSDISPAALRRPTFVYNYAVILFHARHYKQAGEVLQRLIDEKTEEGLKRRVVLLAAEVMLCRRLAAAALEVLTANKKLFERDCPEESVMLLRQSYRARLMLGERVEVSGGAEAGVEGVVLAAHAESVRGEFPAAARTLAAHGTLAHAYTQRTHGEDVWPALNNNLGVIHLALDKPALAAKYFQTAVKEQLVAESSADNSSRLLCVRDRPLLVYNLGLALLRARRTAPAFDCLVEAARHFPANPGLWRRLAECCVRHVVPDSTAPPVVIRYGSGAHIRLAVTSPHRIPYSTQGESFAIPSLSLEFAALCLRNALTLLRRTSEPVPAPPGAPLPPPAAARLRSVVLTLQSYVMLKLQEPLLALQSCSEPVGEGEGGGGGAGAGGEALSVLRRVYAAEALVRLERLQEATDRLHPAPLHNLLSALPRRHRHALAAQVWATAAACHAVRGDAATARNILSQLDSPRTLALQLYLELAAGGAGGAGDAAGALAILRNIPTMHTHTVH